MTELIKAEEMEAKNRKQEMSMIREKQAEVDKLESALSRLNIATSPVQISFMTFPPVGGSGWGGVRERLF